MQNSFQVLFLHKVKKIWYSKKVELLSRVFDHTGKKYLKGFRMLTLGWSDGYKARIIFVSCDKKRVCSRFYQQILP